MKNKFIKIIPIIGIGALLVTPIFTLSLNQNKQNIDSYSSNFNNFNLETEALSSPNFMQSNGAMFKNYVRIHDQEKFYTSQDGEVHGVVSENSINTVRSATHFFNFINNNPDGFVRVIATPTEANFSNILEIATPYTLIEDSAIFLNDKLFVIGTINNTKWLSIYEIRDLYPNLIQGKTTMINSKKELIELSRIQLPNILNIDTAFKYALSPIEKTFDDGNSIDFILWPMGITPSKLEENRFIAFKYITVDKNGNSVIFDLPMNFSSNSFAMSQKNFPIMSLTPIQNIKIDGTFDLKFYSHIVPLDNRGSILLAEFSVGGHTLINNIYDPTLLGQHNAPWTPTTLESAIPYAYVQTNDIGFSLFWIAQNGQRINSGEINPSIMTRVNISFTNDSFNDIIPANISNVILSPTTSLSGNSFLQNGFINQIHYGVGGNLEAGAYISLRSKGFFENSVDQTSWNSRVDLIELKDGNLNGNSSLPSVVDFSASMKTRSTRASMSTTNTDVPKMMITTYNGISIIAGIDNYAFALGTANPVLTNPAPMTFSKKNAQSFNFDLNSNQVTNTIILPSKLPEDPNAYDFGMPIKVSNIKFSSPFATDSIMNRVRWFINDLSDRIFFFQSGFRMVLSGGVTYWDINNNIIPVKPADQAIPPPNAVAAEFFITIPQPIINGAVSTSSPVTFKFIVIDNPVQSNDVGFLPVNFNKGSQNPEFAAIVLNSFNNSRIIPNNQDILGTSGKELISINKIFLDFNLANISATGNNFTGTLKGEINFIDPNGNILNIPINISGLEATFILIPSILVPIIIIIILVLITAILLSKRNKKSSKKLSRSAFALASNVYSNNTSGSSNAKTINMKSWKNPVIIPWIGEKEKYSPPPLKPLKRKIPNTKISPNFDDHGRRKLKIGQLHKPPPKK